MMPSCRDIERLLSCYVDREASAAEREVVSEHLQACGTCRARAEAEAAGRLVLRTSAPRLREQAPASLLARCRPASPRAGFLSLSWLGVWPMRGFAMAAAALLIVTAITFAAGGNARVMAAELALDHMKCFALFERASAESDPARLARQIHASYGWRLTVPPSSPALALALVGGRRCFSTDGRVAHMLYRYRGRPLSLFVMPDVMRAAADVGVIGHQAIVWSRRGMTYAVVAREPHDDLARVAAYMKEHVE